MKYVDKPSHVFQFSPQLCFAEDPETGEVEVWVAKPGEQWQGCRRKGDPVVLSVDPKRGRVVYGPPPEE